MANPKGSSKKWLDEHNSDDYVNRAKKDGYRSRASYKIIEMHQKDKLFKSNMTIVDLGSSPGGWSQVVANYIKPSGKIIALDIIEMNPLPYVEFIKGDFTEDETYEKLCVAVNDAKIDWVISDMAPNISGNRNADQFKSMHLCEIALDFASKFLAPGGGFLIKVFQGAGSQEYINNLKKLFKKVVIRKPKSSRPRSREIYVIAFEFKA